MTNRLGQEASPYLRQHAENPVDWHAWSPEALALAIAEDKPILLSIGYSACHWCHVMAHESFEDSNIAAQMNAHFINIKVDREERPDLDQIYQLTVQLMGRSGGWPLTVFLTPQQKPFFAGTYFPNTEKYGMPSFGKVLEAVAETFRDKRQELESQATDLTDAITKVTKAELTPVSSEKLTPDATRGATANGPLLGRAVKALSQRFDAKHGGFGGRPKFPNTMGLELFLRAAVAGDSVCRERVLLTLDHLRAGGIYDQLGFGFHRYSTDEKWLVPHFEKMLYDNALLIRLYADAARAFGRQEDQQVVLEVATYVSSEMTSPDGAFFASQDADSVPIESPNSHAEEGAFFVWTPDQIQAAVQDESLSRLACKLFGVTSQGTFEDGPASVLCMPDTLKEDEFTQLGTDEVHAATRQLSVRESLRERLKVARDHRPRPFRDEKILTSWNALMVSGLVEGFMATQDTTLLQAAKRAFDNVCELLLRDHRLLRVAPPPRTTAAREIPGFLDDYAFMANAALDLYEATQHPSYVTVAHKITAQAVALFADTTEGGFFFSPSDGEILIHRSKDPFDHAIPSAVSKMAEALLRLSSLDGDSNKEHLARQALEGLAEVAVRSPLGLGQSLLSLDRLTRGPVEIVVVGAQNDPSTRALLSMCQTTYVPNRILAFVDPDDATTSAACPALAAGKAAQAVPVVYVCRNRTCSAPVNTPEALSRLLTSAL